MEGVDVKALVLKLTRPVVEGMVGSACQGGGAGLLYLARHGRQAFEESLNRDYGLDLVGKSSEFVNKSTLYNKVTEAVERK